MLIQTALSSHTNATNKSHLSWIGDVLRFEYDLIIGKMKLVNDNVEKCEKDV